MEFFFGEVMDVMGFMKISFISLLNFLFIILLIFRSVFFKSAMEKDSISLLDTIVI